MARTTYTPLFMADPPARRTTPDYHAAVAVRELPSCDIVTLAHPEEAESIAVALNEHFTEGK